MNKDRVEGKVKDIAGRVERQAGEWADDPEHQAKGAAKQVEGKVQNAWGHAKDASENADNENTSKRKKTAAEDEIEAEERRRSA